MFEIIKNLPKLLQSADIAFVKKKKEAQNAYTFVFQKPKFGFKAGQHFIFVLQHKNVDDRKAMRVFSISSAPSDDYFTITTRYFGDESSSYKRALFAMKPGDTINVRGPSPLLDHFKIKDYSQANIYIVGGIGVTPLYSVLRDVANAGKRFQADIYYCNKDEDFIFGAELEKLMHKLPDVNLYYVISPERITEDLLQKSLDRLGENTVITISGTSGFTKTYSEMAKYGLGIQNKRIKGYSYKPFIGAGY